MKGLIIDDALLDGITRKAEENERQRMNFNLHESLDSKAQRLINVLLPETKMPVHRHQHTAETYVVLRGELDVVFYNDKGEDTERHNLKPSEGRYGVHIPSGQWHGIDVKVPTAILEVKEGPYIPLAEENTLNLPNL